MKIFFVGQAACELRQYSATSRAENLQNTGLHVGKYACTHCTHEAEELTPGRQGSGSTKKKYFKITRSKLPQAHL